MDSLTGSNLEVMNTGSIRSQCKRVRNQPLTETEFEVPAKRIKINHIKKEVFECETSCVQRISDTEDRVRNATPSVKSEPLEIEIPSFLITKSEPFGDKKIPSLKTEFMPFMTENTEIHGPPPIFIKSEPHADEVITSLTPELTPFIPLPLVTKTEEIAVPPLFIKPEPLADNRATLPIKNKPAISVERTCWKKPVPLANTGIPQPTNEIRPLLPENKATVRTTQPRTSVPLAKPRRRRKNRQTIKQNASTPLANTATTPAKQPSNVNIATKTLCELNEELQTAEHKKMYQVTALEKLKSHRRPGHSLFQLRYFTSILEGYVNTLKIIDPLFMHSPSIMKAVCSKLEPYILSSWCDYAAQYAKSGKPLILTMLDFLHQKVDSGCRYWYPYTKEGANRKM